MAQPMDIVIHLSASSVERLEKYLKKIDKADLPVRRLIDNEIGHYLDWVEEQLMEDEA